MPELFPRRSSTAGVRARVPESPIGPRLKHLVRWPRVVSRSPCRRLGSGASQRQFSPTAATTAWVRVVAVATALATAPSGCSSTPVGNGANSPGALMANGNVWPQLGQRSHRGGGFGTRAVSTKGLAQDLAERKIRGEGHPRDHITTLDDRLYGLCVQGHRVGDRFAKRNDVRSGTRWPPTGALPQRGHR